MANRQLITTTRRDTFAPLLAGGRPVNEAWEQLHCFLSQALGPTHAAVLAEPRINRAADSIDWYGPHGAVRPIDTAGRRRLKVLVGDIRRLADDLDRAGDEGRRSIGRLLRLGFQLPGAAQAYRVGDQPVLVAWGLGAAARQKRVSPLRAAVTFVVVLMLGAVAGGWLWRHLPAPRLQASADPRDVATIVAWHDERDRAVALRQRLDSLRLEAAALRLQCPPPAPPVAAAPKVPASTFAPEVKPSMPATPKKPVEVVPLAPPTRQ